MGKGPHVGIPIEAVYVISYGIPALIDAIFLIFLCIKKELRVSLQGMLFGLLSFGLNVSCILLFQSHPFIAGLRREVLEEIPYSLYPDWPAGPLPWMMLMAFLWFGSGAAIGAFVWPKDNESPERERIRAHNCCIIAMLACTFGCLASNAFWILGISSITY